ncbi:hypothetical protein L1987_47961 [Smallanthus sonchifolius]|uniref:Uncharacterized protein n=1 Tax=Smallanthus sonchifolius TaxID=185202 RepID=A0ACB9FQG4_9ASTR|nr:hypothetical protein L1987_47961 [Smallanthus sonchifolius]
MKLDLGYTELNDTPNIQGKRRHNFAYNDNLERLNSIQLSALKELKALDLSDCGLESLTLNGYHSVYASHYIFFLVVACTMSNLLHLNLDLNDFNNDIMGSMAAFPSLRFLSLQGSSVRGRLFANEVPKLPQLEVLLLGNNNFNGTIPMEALASFHHLTSLEYLDFSHNKFEGSFLFSSFSSHTKLEFVEFISDNDKFEVDTEEPIGWTPMFQLKVLVLSNCNVNRLKGSVVPGFLLHQHKLMKLDISHNSLEGQFPNWLIKNNTMLEDLSLRNNSFHSIIGMSFYRNPNTMWMDMSGNCIIGTIPIDIQKFLPYIMLLNLSRNSLSGVIPSTIGGMSELQILDLSHNEFYGEVTTRFFSNFSQLLILKLSNNKFHGEILSGNLSLGSLQRLHLDRNYFTGKIGNEPNSVSLSLLDISNYIFTGLIPSWISNNTLSEFVVRSNMLSGQFPCGTASFGFLDISQNYFSGPIPSCINFQSLEHLHLGSNRFTGSIPNSFHNLTGIITLGIGNNYLSGKIPKFLGQLSNLRILLLGKNNFSGSIPKQLCQLSNASLIDLSSNSLFGSIPQCLQDITGPSYQAFIQSYFLPYSRPSTYSYSSVLNKQFVYYFKMFETQVEIRFTTKTLSLTYKGGVLEIMSGLDLSCNKLTGNIPKELGLLTHIRVLNLSHNLLAGPIPLNLSNLTKIESLDLSSNSFTGKVPSELVRLNSLASFNVSYNNLSGRLPEMKAQFSTFTKESYEGNSLLCGPPLDIKCTIEEHVIHPSNGEGTDEKWYDMDMTSFYGSCASTCVVFLFGFVALLYINPYRRRRWLFLVEECMYACCYFLNDLVRMPFFSFV